MLYELVEPLSSLGITWMHLVSLGLTWFHLVSHGFTWFHLVSLISKLFLLEFIWFHLDSLGFTGQGEKGRPPGAKREKGRPARRKFPRSD